MSTTTPSSPAVDTELAAIVNDLAAVAEDLGLPKVAHNIREHATRRMDGQTLRVAVLGEVNHGKSSLINALLGADELPTSAIPTTHQLIRVRHGDAPGYYIVSPTSRTKVNRAAFEAAVRDPRPTPQVLEIECTNERLPPSLEILDTPGLNDLEHFHEAIARQQLPGADVVVLVLDATQVLSRTERHSLDDALTAVGGARSGVDFELVINRIDLVAEHERALIVEHVREQLQGLPFETLDPFLTDARGSSQRSDAREFGAREVQRLRERIFALGEQRRELLPRRARAELGRQARLLASHAAIQSRAAQLDDATVEQEIAAIQQALLVDAVDIEALRAEITERSTELAARSHDRIAKHRTELEQHAADEIKRADLRQLSEILPGALRDAHLLFTRNEAERVRDELDQLTRSILQTHGEQARRRLYRATLQVGFSGPAVHIEPPSLAIEAGTVLLGALGTAIMYFGNVAAGLIMAVASPLTHVWLRERTIRRARAHANETIPQALDRACTELQHVIDRVVQSHADSLDQYICGADQALADQLVSVLTRARERHTEDNGSPKHHTSIEQRLADIARRIDPTCAAAAEFNPAQDDFVADA